MTNSDVAPICQLTGAANIVRYSLVLFVNIGCRPLSGQSIGSCLPTLPFGFQRDLPVGWQAKMPAYRSNMPCNFLLLQYQHEEQSYSCLDIGIRLRGICFPFLLHRLSD